MAIHPRCEAKLCTQAILVVASRTQMSDVHYISRVGMSAATDIEARFHFLKALLHQISRNEFLQP